MVLSSTDRCIVTTWDEKKLGTNVGANWLLEWHKDVRVDEKLKPAFFLGPKRTVLQKIVRGLLNT